MSDTTAKHFHPPLGIGRLLGEGFRWSWQSAIPLMVIFGSVAGIEIAANVANEGTAALDPFLQWTNPEAAATVARTTSPAITLALAVVVVALWSLAGGAAVLLVADRQAGDVLSVPDCLRAAIARFSSLVLCSIVAILAVLLGLALLVVPGLYLMAAWYAVIPAIMLEGAGMGAFGRSARLTRGYRWPLVGLSAIFLLIHLVVAIVAAGVQSLFAQIGGPMLIASALTGVLTGAGLAAFGSALSVAVYLRLREIGEVSGAPELAAVFD